MLKTLHGRYEILEKLATGGTGDVFKARDKLLERLVAIKRVRKGSTSHRELKAALLLQEARKLASVRHLNVVTIHDLLEGETSVSLVMELVEGPPLRELFLKRPLAEEDLLVHFRQLLAALEAVHAAGLIHRDVNPKNVLVGDDGLLKLTDFGLAGAAKDPKLRAGGNIGYMAPEALKRNVSLDFTVDVYGAGFLAYQALIGLPAFKKLYGTSAPQEWARWLLSREEFRSLTSLSVAVSPALSRIVSRMIEKDPRARYPRVAAVRQDLEAAAARGLLGPEAAVKGALSLTAPPRPDPGRSSGQGTR
jgi:serine/threonine-protein kinase